MFTKLSIYDLHNSEFIQYIYYLLEVLKAKKPEQLKVKEIYDTISSKYQLMTSIFKPERGSDITPQIEEADKRRDTAINGIISLLDAYVYHYIPEKRDAALCLLNEISNHGRGISRFNYQSETSTIESIVTRWKGSSECVSALEKLMITDWVEEMDSANKDFRKYYFERMQEDAENPEIRLKEVRKEVTELYRFLINQLEIFATINSNEVYYDTIRSINELNERYNQLVLARQSSGGADEAQDANDLSAEINEN
jgi:hypothetical protein